MVCTTYCFVLWSKCFAVFVDCFITAEIFCEYLLSIMLKIGSVTGNCQNFQEIKEKLSTAKHFQCKTPYTANHSRWKSFMIFVDQSVIRNFN